MTEHDSGKNVVSTKQLLMKFACFAKKDVRKVALIKF